MDSHQIYSSVSRRYTQAAASTTPDTNIAKAFGYSDQDLASIPSGANLGLSCGNPLATATLRKGEVVIDLGSGAGLDVFLAAEKVGPNGKVIGVDMNKDMLAKANNLLSTTAKTNIQFIEARITDIPLPAGTADCIISNCVINLVPRDEKQDAFNEIFRLLKPGGRVAISDILARKVLSEEIRRDVGLYVGCVAGASLVSEYEGFLKHAGFRDVVIADAGGDLDVYSGECCGGKGDGFKGDLNEWAGSFKIYAVKP